MSTKPNWNTLKPMPYPKNPHSPLVIGHRGAAGLAPENTLAAFQKAVDLGIDGVEFDIQRTTDGELVVFHDETVDRTTDGKGETGKFSLPELKALDTGKWFLPDFAGEKIATFAEVLDLLKNANIILHVELKDPWLYPNMEQEVVDMLRKYDYVERCQIRSFYHPVLFAVHEIAPEFSISELWWQVLPTAEETNFKTINGQGDLYTAEYLAEVHARGQKATAWTVNDMELARNLIAMGIDGITTDYPDKVLKLATKV